MEANNSTVSYIESIKQLNSISSTISLVLDKSLVLTKPFKSAEMISAEAPLLKELAKSILKVSRELLSTDFGEKSINDHVENLAKVVVELSTYAFEVSEIMAGVVNEPFKVDSEMIQNKMEKQRKIYSNIFRIARDTSYIPSISECSTMLKEIISDLLCFTTTFHPLLSYVSNTIITVHPIKR